MYQIPSVRHDLRENGRIILAHGEVTGHCHEVVSDVDSEIAVDLPAYEYFEEPDTGRRILFALRPCVLRHQEHGAIALDPAMPEQVRQGDVLLTPIGSGCWVVTRQVEWPGPDGWRVVKD